MVAINGVYVPVNSQLKYNSESNSQLNHNDQIWQNPVNSQLKYNSESNSQRKNTPTIKRGTCE